MIDTCCQKLSLLCTNQVIFCEQNNVYSLLWLLYTHTNPLAKKLTSCALMYLQVKQISLWPPQVFVQAHIHVYAYGFQAAVYHHKILE